MNTALAVFFIAAGAFALAVIVVAGRRAARARRRLTTLLAMDATARDVRRAEREQARRQKGMK